MEASWKRSSKEARSDVLTASPPAALRAAPVPAAAIPPVLSRGSPSPLARSLARSSVLNACPSHPGRLAQVSWVGLVLGKDGGEENVDGQH